jgi:5-methylcytosine-specific restriction endonuclease McrA
MEKKQIIYPENWPEVSTAIKLQACWKCEHCGHPHEFITGYVLTVHHLDHIPKNLDFTNLVAFCQRCHLTIDRWWNPNQLWFPGMKPPWAEIRGY